MRETEVFALSVFLCFNGYYEPYCSTISPQTALMPIPVGHTRSHRPQR